MVPRGPAGVGLPARAGARDGRRPRLGSVPDLHRRGARRQRRGHARVRPRRARRHDGPAVALLDGRRRPDHRAAVARPRARRSRRGPPTAAPRSSRCSRPARPSTRRPRARSRWSRRSSTTASASCRAPSSCEGEFGVDGLVVGVPDRARRRRHGARLRDRADARRTGRRSRRPPRPSGSWSTSSPDVRTGLAPMRGPRVDPDATAGVRFAASGGAGGSPEDRAVRTRRPHDRRARRPSAAGRIWSCARAGHSQESRHRLTGGP